MSKERIIESLEYCRKNQKSNDCESCEYGGRSFQICERLVDDILVLLKEHEAVKPIYSEEKFGDFLPHCTVCKKVLPSVSQYGKSNFCYNCKQAVKWNG